jgi:prolyl-tRNA synthetase
VHPRHEGFSRWYGDVLREAHLVDSSPVRGCYVLMPNGYALWEHLRRDLDQRIASTGVVNAYFPLLIPQSFFSKEASHVDGFAKECAVVTHSRLRSGAGGSAVEVDPESALAEPLIVRPTSETIIWNSFKRWVSTHADLPILVNQWANVLRWEMRTRPLLRSSEFLWQEGHTAHATREEAVDRAHQMIRVYEMLARECLALPTVPGHKSPRERFAGAEDTLTIEAMMQDGWALQAGTSHMLGTAFGDAFGVVFDPGDGGPPRPVFATSWGASTRLLGAVVLTHSDDTGFVAPPAISPVQVEIVPLSKSAGAVDRVSEELRDILARAGIRAAIDTQVRPFASQATASSRLRQTLGKRRFAVERRGTPLRIEVGDREIARGVLSITPRVPLHSRALDRCVASLDGKGEQQYLMSRWGGHIQTSESTLREAATLTVRLRGDEQLPLDVSSVVHGALDLVHASLLLSAEDRLRARTVRLFEWEDLVKLGQSLSRADEDEPADLAHRSDSPSFAIVPWCDDEGSEARVKELTKLTIRCFPFELQDQARGQRCIATGRPATHMALFARAY